MEDIQESWDVIVVGGGPAGSTAARYIAEGGIDVLVIDGRNPIGSPLQCGELVPSNDEMKRLCPDVPDIDNLLQTPENVISRTTDKMRLVPPSGKQLCFDFDGVILNRTKHDEELVKIASEKGATYLVGKRVDRVEENRVILRDGAVFNAKIIIGAGGHNDPIRRNHWNEKTLNVPVKFVLMNGEFPNAVELHFGSNAPGGYAWMIPKKNGANIGVGIQQRYSKDRNLNQCAEDFISKYEGEITFTGAGSLPMSGTIDSFVKGNYMLVGDAAGMVLPSNGAGITIAMIGGRIAGQVAVEHIKQGTSLEQYQIRWNKQIGKVMRNSKRSFVIASLMFRAPDWLINLGFNRLTKNFIWRAVTCRKIFWLF